MTKAKPVEIPKRLIWESWKHVAANKGAPGVDKKSIQAFFDTIDHDLMMRAVEKHVPEKWIRLYIERWLKCDVEREDGTTESPICGTPQGGVISPLLANLYLHYAFDAWMQRHHPSTPFERYADDVVCHCRSKEEAESLLEALRERLADCRLELHPDKTRVVYCKDNRRRGDYPNTRFDFLGFSFHARTVQDRYGNLFTGFGPGVSRKALKRMNQVVRSLMLHRKMQWKLPDLAARLNPIVRGWIAYYGAFYPEPCSDFRSDWIYDWGDGHGTSSSVYVGTDGDRGTG